MDTSEFEMMERDGWSDPSIAGNYADRFAAATRFVAKHLAENVHAGPGLDVLDLCSGHGVVAAELARRGANTTGLDFSAAMVSLAEAAVPEALFLQGDAMAMAFGDASFDAVTIGFGVPHLPDPGKGLAEAARVLKPGGRVSFSIWRGPGSDGGFGWLFDALEVLGDPSVTLPPGPDAHALADPENAIPLMESAGFTNISLEDVDSCLTVEEPEDLYRAFAYGAVRAASVLSGQTEAVRKAIEARLADTVRAKCDLDGAGYVVPVPSVVVSADKPS